MMPPYVFPSDLPPSLRLLAAVWAAMVGAVLGSFLNVVIARVPAGKSIVRPGSRCPGCGTPIAWYDNIPVLSFLLLRARCRACHRPISWRYPLVEVLGVGAALLAFQRHGLSLSALAELCLLCLLLALTFIDIDTWLLPYPLTLPLLGTGLFASAFHLSMARSFTSALLGAAIGGGVFFAVSFVGEKLLRKEALGLGDVWLLAGIGAWLGARALIPVVLLASLQGALWGVGQLLAGKGQKGAPAEEAGRGKREALGASGGEEEWVPPRHAVPFGPFLAAGALEWLYLALPLSRVVVLFQPFT